MVDSGRSRRIDRNGDEVGQSAVEEVFVGEADETAVCNRPPGQEEKGGQEPFLRPSLSVLTPGLYP